MKKLAEFLINRRRVLTAVMLVLTAVCAVLALRVPINRDRTKYLADSSEMKQGLSIMEASVSARTTTQSGSSVAGTSLFSYAIV